MIKSKKDYLDYLEADRLATYRKNKNPKFLREHEWRYLRVMRKVEYYTNCKRGLINKLIVLYYRQKMYKLGLRCGFSIAPNTTGKGLKLFHYGTIVINGSSKLGDYCQVQTGVNIAANCKIGNNVYIFPGVKILSDISIADNVRIGANAVVTKNILESNITVAGIPAKKVSSQGSI